MTIDDQLAILRRRRACFLRARALLRVVELICLLVFLGCLALGSCL